jgi:hypothetical protein
MGGPIFTQPVEGVDNGSTGYGVRGSSGRDNGVGVYGNTNSLNGIGVYGYSEENEGQGVRGYSSRGDGVVGIGPRNGIRGNSYRGYGVSGYSQGMHRGAAGVYGESDRYIGVHGFSRMGGIGVYGRSDSVYGVDGYSLEGVGVHGLSSTGNGVVGYTNGVPTPRGLGRAGVYGGSYYGHGVRAYSNQNYGLYVEGYEGYAAYLKGEVLVDGPLGVGGDLYVNGGKFFMIDHPLDPANKYLYHSSVESPDMKTVYDGVVSLDDKGEAIIELPDWFSALNKDFRYQLTAIGAPGPNLYIAEEISDVVTDYSNNSSSGGNKNRNISRFKIAGGTSNIKVSWQVTGIRQDPYAKAHPIQVEADKPHNERGYYLYPELYGQPAENGISHLLFPEEDEELLVNENKRSRRKMPF